MKHTSAWYLLCSRNLFIPSNLNKFSDKQIHVHTPVLLSRDIAFYSSWPVYCCFQENSRHTVREHEATWNKSSTVLVNWYRLHCRSGEYIYIHIHIHNYTILEIIEHRSVDNERIQRIIRPSHTILCFYYMGHYRVMSKCMHKQHTKHWHRNSWYLQARTQGGFDGFGRTPPGDLDGSLIAIVC